VWRERAHALEVEAVRLPCSGQFCVGFNFIGDLVRTCRTDFSFGFFWQHMNVKWYDGPVLGSVWNGWRIPGFQAFSIEKMMKRNHI
jgi:hypothetical protein